eukprot:6950855-Pyramimonas_sp.AAC.1
MPRGRHAGAGRGAAGGNLRVCVWAGEPQPQPRGEAVAGGVVPAARQPWLRVRRAGALHYHKREISS